MADKMSKDHCEVQCSKSTTDFTVMEHDCCAILYEDKVVTIRCTVEAMELFRQLEFVWEDESGDDFSCSTSWAGFKCEEGEKIGYLKVAPSFVECLCNGGYFADEPEHEHILQTHAEVHR